MSRALHRTLGVLSAVALMAALIILLHGGGVIAIGGATIRASGFANPLAWSLIFAGLQRLVLPHRPDVLATLWRRLVLRGERAFGSGCERLRGVLVLRGDAILMALLAVWVFDRGSAGIVEVEGDGVGYYAYLRSVLLDGDLDFLNEYRDFDARQQWVDRTTPIGRVENPFAIGPALLWAPFFALGWGAAAVLDATGTQIALSGYSKPFLWATAGGTWLYGMAGLVILYRLLLAQFDRTTALVATFGTAMASPLAYYLTYAIFYSHAVAFFTATLFLWACFRTRTDAPMWRWLVLGLAGGLSALTRWQDAVLWLVPAVLLLQAALADLGSRELAKRLPGHVGRGLAFLAGCAIAVAPQLVVFHRLNGYWLGVPQGDDFVTAWPRWLMPTLFDWFHGLYSWSPLLLVATGGLVWATIRHRPWALAMTTALVAQMWVNGSVSQWWAGHAFGARRFTSVAALFAFGLAVLLAHAATHRRWRRALYVTIGIACVWNHLLLHQWLMQAIPHGAPMDPAIALSHAWDDVTGLELRRLIGLETGMSLALYRLSALADRWLLIASSTGLLLLTRRRADNLAKPTNVPIA